MTSQIFANIYLNEFDQFVLHSLKPLGYVRYGDDFVLWHDTELAARQSQIIASQFLLDELHLSINPKHDKLQPTSHKLAYLGVDIWPNGKRLNKRVKNRINSRLTTVNAASYSAITRQHLPKRYSKRLTENLLDIIDQV